MNVYVKYFSFVFSFVFCLSFISAFDACNVNYDQPWFEVKDSSGDSVLIVDNDGDVFMAGESVTTNPVSSSIGGFAVGNNMYFDSVNSFYKSKVERSTSIPVANNAFVVKNTAGVVVASFLKSGQIIAAGVVDHEFSQSNCEDDYWFCKSGTVKAEMDFYCDITGSDSGSCASRVINDYNCESLEENYCSGSTKMKHLYSCSGAGDCVNHANQNLGNCPHGCSGGACNPPPPPPPPPVVTPGGNSGSSSGSGGGSYRSWWAQVGGGWSCTGYCCSGSNTCGHSVGCSCPGVSGDSCGHYREGTNVKFSPNGCGGVVWTIKCKTQLQ